MPYYVVLDEEDPGSEHDTEEEAIEVLNSYRDRFPRGIIIPPHCNRINMSMSFTMSDEYFEQS